MEFWAGTGSPSPAVSVFWMLLFFPSLIILFILRVTLSLRWKE